MLRDFLIESTQIWFTCWVLKKWLQTVGEKNYLLRKQESIRSEKDCVFNWSKVEQWLKWHQNHFEDWKVHYKKYPSANGTIGQTNPTDEEVQGIVARVLSTKKKKDFWPSGCWEIVRIV
jgi:trigger factor